MFLFVWFLSKPTASTLVGWGLNTGFNKLPSRKEQGTVPENYSATPVVQVVV
jgi:hypothetical protein